MEPIIVVNDIEDIFAEDIYIINLVERVIDLVQLLEHAIFDRKKYENVLVVVRR